MTARETFRMTSGESKVAADPVLSTDVENVDMTVEMQEYRLRSWPSVFDAVDSAKIDNLDILKLKMPDLILCFK